HPLCRFLSGPDVWNHQAVRAELQRLHGAVVSGLFDAHHQVDTGQPACARDSIDDVDAEVAMLQVEPHNVIANRADDFDQPGIGDTAYSRNANQFTGTQQLQYSTWRQRIPPQRQYSVLRRIQRYLCAIPLQNCRSHPASNALDCRAEGVYGEGVCRHTLWLTLPLIFQVISGSAA